MGCSERIMRMEWLPQRRRDSEALRKLWTQIAQMRQGLDHGKSKRGFLGLETQ